MVETSSATLLKRGEPRTRTLLGFGDLRGGHLLRRRITSVCVWLLVL